MARANPPSRSRQVAEDPGGLGRRAPLGGCPVKARSIQLRSLCASCDGRARCGQAAYAPRTPLFLQGDPADSIFAVIQGCLREVRTTDDGRSQPIRVVGPGELAGLDGLSCAVHQITAETLTRVVACRVAVSEVRAFLRDNPEYSTGLLSAAISELRAIRESALWLGALTADERLLALLRLLTRDAAPGAFVQMPLQRVEMAEFLGLAHATVCRAVQRFARAGLIEVQGQRIRFINRGQQ